MEKAFRARIGSYLPGWQYEKEGQPEAALLYAAGRLLEDTRSRLDRLPEKHEIEFLRAWGLEPVSAEPMSVYAAFSAPEGAQVPAGSEWYLSGDGARLWRNTNAAQAESLSLAGQVLESEREGTLIVLPPPTVEAPARLFDFSGPGQQRQAVRFAHRDAFRSQNGCEVRLEFPDADPALLPLLADAASVRWTLEGRKPPTGQPLAMPQQDGGTLVFSLPSAPSAHVLVAEILPGVPAPKASCGAVLVSVQREAPAGLRVVNGAVAAEGDFFPFGLEPDTWCTCCLSCPDVLSLRGGRVTLTCTLSYVTCEELLPGTEQPPEYRPIMRRLPTPPPEPRDVFVQSVSWEYWNGSAWRPIPDTQGWAAAFDGGGESGAVRAEFCWPADARPCEIQGQAEYWLRWRVSRADGAGYLPRRLHVPQVRDLRMKAELRGQTVELAVCSGLEDRFCPRERGERGRLFPALGTGEDGWWLRFDHPPHGDTLTLFAALDSRVPGGALTVWESTPDGQRRLGLEDDTDGLCHSGPMHITGIRGVETERFGQRGWWLCFRDSSGGLSAGRRHPKLAGLIPGAVCLQAEGEDTCQAGETVLPLRGGVVSGKTLTDSFGGRPPERKGEALARARLYRHHLGRGVSPLDVEQLLRAQVRDVVRTRCRREDGRVLVAVLLEDVHQHSLAFARQRKRIVRLLTEETALPTLGLSVEVREPSFYLVQAALWICPAPNHDPQVEAEAVRLALTQFLHPVTGRFRGDGWRIGELPEEQEVRNYLREQLPQVELVKILLTAVTPQGWEVRCAEVEDPFALPVPGGCSVYIVERRERG